MYSTTINHNIFHSFVFGMKYDDSLFIIGTIAFKSYFILHKRNYDIIIIRSFLLSYKHKVSVIDSYVNH